MNTVKVDIGGWIQRAFELYKTNFGTLLLVNLIGGLLSAATFGILAGPLYVGVLMVTLRLLDRASPVPEVGDVFKGFSHFLPAFVVVLLVGIVSMLLSAMVPFIGGVLGLAISTLLMFCLPLLADGRATSISDLLSRSVEMVKANFWPLLALNLLAVLLSSVGAIACFIGVLFTAPLYACVVAVAYRAHVPAAGTPPPMA